MEESILKKMKSQSVKAVFPFILLFLLLPGLLQASPADSGEVEIHSSIDWSTGQMLLTVNYSPSDRPILRSSLRQDAVAVVRKHLPSFFLNEISAVKIDSRHTVYDRLLESPALTRSLRELALEAPVQQAHFNRDFSTFSQSFRYNLYPDIVSLFISHQRAVPQIPVLEYVASGNYSGIVIFAEGELPVYGTHRKDTLKPALLPTVYDPETDAVIDAHMIAPEQIRQRGMLHYYRSSETEKISEAVGEVPLFIHAVGLFGINSTDIIVSKRSAQQIRANEHSLALIREGKIAVVY